MPNQDIQGSVTNILNIDDEYDVDDEIEVGGTTVARSDAFFLHARHTFAWGVKLSSDGAIDVKIELEQRFETDGEWAVPDNKVDFPMFEITDSNFHIVSYAPISSYFGRLKCTGQGSNDATTKITVAKMYVARN